MAMKLIDIGANLTDDMFQGKYHETQKHAADLDRVLDRAWDAGLEKIIITGTSYSDSKTALKTAKSNDRLFCTVGCHPTRCNDFDGGDGPDCYYKDLLQHATQNSNKVVAIGECGLDYDRTNFCSIDVQKKYFEKQIGLAEATNLPMFLHCRKSANDLVSILKRYRSSIVGGVVHSFDGSMDDLKRVLSLDLYIGINGCSLKTENNLKVAASIPIDKLLIETDSPWCDVRPTHAGFKYIETSFLAKKKEKFEMGVMVKRRNEPCNLRQVLEILSRIRNEDMVTLAENIHRNTEKLFFNK